MSKKPNNTIILGDSLYEITKEYAEGAEAMRKSIPWDCNPYRRGSNKAENWENGHVHESAGEHVRFGMDVVSQPKEGRCFEEDPAVPRDESGNIDMDWYRKSLHDVQTFSDQKTLRKQGFVR